MALVNLSLLLGGLGIALPIVLHLTMRRQPRKLVFPAVRFLKQRRETNQRQLQLRHWILLALRCLAIATGALALARPSVAAAALSGWSVVALLGGGCLLVALIALAAAIQRRGRMLVGGLSALAALLLLAFGWLLVQTWRHGSPRLLGDQEAPVAAAILIDASPRMSYRFENRSRLEVAQETAAWLVEQLPDRSDTAVVDARPGTPVFALDRAAALQAIQRIQISGTAESLPRVLERILPWTQQSSHLRREIYILTDLTAGAWPAEAAANLKTRLAEFPDVQLYVIDLGVAQPHNAGLGTLRLSAESLPRSGELELQSEVTSWGISGTRTVELLVEEADPTRPVLQDGRVLVPRAVPRGRQLVELSSGGSQAVQLRLRGWSPGTQQGELRLVGEDGLAIDDVRYFTVEIEDAQPVLVLAPPGTVTRYLVEAIAPYEFRQSGQARFECREASQTTLGQQNLNEFAVVCLLDPQPLTPDEWRRLAQYVTDGGSLALFLGHNAQASGSFHDPTAQQLLGGTLARQWRSGAGDLFLAPTNFDHPITREFRGLATSVPWDQFPVYRHWEFDPLAAASRVVLSYGNRRPAIIENSLGRGRVVTMTTPVSDPVRPRGRPAWNELPTAPDAWPFVMLTDQLISYLAGARGMRLNYRAGETAVLVNQEGADPDRYQLFTPTEETQDLTARGGRVVVKSTDEPGAYRLKGFRGEPVIRGFSVNIDPAATDLTRVAPQRLDDSLGAGRFQLAKTRDEIDRNIGEARVGREFFPFLLLALAGVLGLEQVLANRFYGPKS